MNSKIIFLASEPLSVVVFIFPHLRVLCSRFNLKVFANTKESDLLQKRGLDVVLGYAPVVRSIKPWADLKALWVLYRTFSAEKPNVVHTITPKAGLLGMAAAYLSGVPIRVHSFTGQVWVTRKGPMRSVLKIADKCIAALATDVLVDSPSQRDFLISEGVLTFQGSSVLGAGSICGVDTKRFHSNHSARSEVRTEMNSADDAIVCLYLGRLNRDKGVLDLAAAFANLSEKYPKAELWIVGPDEENIFPQMLKVMGAANAKVRRVGFTNEPERFMQSADLFCLPSYREGFGSSVIEAAACGVPALVSRIYGLSDAVIEDVTGWMHNPSDVEDLTRELSLILGNLHLLSKASSAAQEYANKYFAQHLITQAMLDFYDIKLK